MAPLVREIHDELGGDAWVIGRVTGSEFAKGKPYPETPARSCRAKTGLRGAMPKTCGILLDAHGKTGWAAPTAAAIRSS